MGHINNFPVEILALIFQSAASQSLQPDLYMLETKRNFPFNAATVCVLWLNILKTRPDYWKTVTFDIAHDPTPFLDNLGLYPGDGIQVKVISTVPRVAVFEGAVSEHEEASRVRQIMTCLRPYLSVCNAIEFDLAYQSSLPSSADILTHHLPQLSSLVFHCLVNDLNDEEINIKIDWDTISLREHFHHPVFPALEEVILTGVSFMELSQLGPQWAQNFRANTSYHLSVSHFTFRKAGPQDSTGSRSVHAFLRTIAILGTYDCFDLSLNDLSIDYLPTIKTGKYRIPFTEIMFENVSQDFLSTFFASISTSDLQQPLPRISFEHCSIPPVNIEARIPTDMLYINSTVASSSESDDQIRLHDSIYNAVSAFQPAKLYLFDCEDLCDTFFEWLSGEDDHVSVTALSTLYVQCCQGFSSRGLCTFVQTRSAQSRKYSPGIVSPIRDLLVTGHYHPLAKEDAQWFREAEDEINVYWSVHSPQDVGEEYLTSFKTKSHLT